MTSVDGLRPHSLKQQSCTFFFWNLVHPTKKLLLSHLTQQECSGVVDVWCGSGSSCHRSGCREPTNHDT
jgi:hypothetical protein